MDGPPEIGALVCDCWFNHQRIVAINPVDNDLVTLENGLVCSFSRCCSATDHSDKDCATLPEMPEDWQPVCAYLIFRDRHR